MTPSPTTPPGTGTPEAMPTPRTDAQTFFARPTWPTNNEPPEPIVTQDFARQLERELATATQQLAAMTEQRDSTHKVRLEIEAAYEDVQSERNALRQQLSAMTKYSEAMKDLFREATAPESWNILYDEQVRLRSQLNAAEQAVIELRAALANPNQVSATIEAARQKEGALMPPVAEATRVSSTETPCRNGWFIPSNRDLSLKWFATFEEAMEKLFEGYNIPVFWSNGVAENFDTAHARVAAYLNKKAYTTPACSLAAQRQELEQVRKELEQVIFDRDESQKYFPKLVGRVEQLSTALSDVLGTFRQDDKTTIITAERQEAWRTALENKGDTVESEIAAQLAAAHAAVAQWRTASDKAYIAIRNFQLDSTGVCNCCGVPCSQPCAETCEARNALVAIDAARNATQTP